jgi:hypothetical protein
MSDRKPGNLQAIRPLANDYVTLFKSPTPDRLFAYSPALERCCSGRLVATIDLGGPDAEKLPGAKWPKGEMGWAWQGRIFTSDDAGQTWNERGEFPFTHARPFHAGNRLYILGHTDDLWIMRSDDQGNTWSAPVKLTEGETWHQAPCNVIYANNCVYLVMEKRRRFKTQGWPVAELAPVLMRGKVDADLTLRESWNFASELPFYEAVDENATDYFGVPFYLTDPITGAEVAPGRYCAPMGWLETNVVQFTEPNHIWADPSGKTFHLWMRSHTGHFGYACIAKVLENGEQAGTGTMTTQIEKAPSGKKIVYVPCPGGQMKFHLIFDKVTQLFWLLSTQATDSMIRPSALPPDRYNLPNNERRRLQLHFSKNMIDWCFAGLVSTGPIQKASRHYATMVIDGDDLAILSRSGDENTKSPHDGNLITFHRIENFRDLVY